MEEASLILHHKILICYLTVRFGYTACGKNLLKSLSLENLVGNTNTDSADEQIKKTSMCTGTQSGNETSLNAIVHEHVKVYMN